MLASTVQFSTYNQTPPARPRQTRDLPQETRRYEKQDGPDREETVARSLRTQQRAYNPVLRAIRVPHATEVTPYWGPTEAGGRTGQCSTLEHCPGHQRTPGNGRPSRSEHSSGPPARVWRPVLLRKEVIQPHLPVRLPCYDFVPIADPAFDGSLNKGWATGFGRYRLS